MSTRNLLVAAFFCAGCAQGEDIDNGMLHANSVATGAGGESGSNASTGASGDSNPTGSGSGGSGQSGSSGVSGSNGTSGNSGQSGSAQPGSGGASPGDASVGVGGQTGSGGAPGTGGSAGSTGAAGSSTEMLSDAGYISGFQVLYANMQTGASSSYIGCELQAKNGGSSTAAVSDLKLRYYFTNDPAKPPQFTQNWAFVRNQGGQWNMKVTATVNALTPAKNNADSFIEFSLSSADHTNVSPNEWVDFSWQIQGPNPSTDKYTQSNDYSWDVGRTSPQQWDHVVLLHNNTVVWGILPP